MKRLSLNSWLALGAVFSLLPVDSLHAQVPGLESCTYWRAPEGIEVGKVVEIRQIGAIGSGEFVSGVAPDGRRGSLGPDTPVSKRVGKPAYLAFLTPEVYGPGTFVAAVEGTLLLSQWIETGPYSFRMTHISNVLGGAVTGKPSAVWTLEAPLRCIRQEGVQHLVDAPTLCDRLSEHVARTPDECGPRDDGTRTLTELAVKLADEGSMPPETNPGGPSRTRMAEDSRSRTGRTSLATVADAPTTCTSSMETIDLGAGFAASPLTVAGLRNDTTKASAYVYDPRAGEPVPHPWRLDLSASKGQLLPLATRAGGRLLPLRDKTGEVVLNEAGKPVRILPVRFAQMETVPVLLPDGTRIETGPPIMRILVVGDAPSVAIAGLADVEQELRKQSAGGYRWGVIWHETLADGTLADGVDFATLAELEAHAATRADADKALLSRSDMFERFTDQLTRRITTAEERIDYVLWIQEGYPLPNNAPLRMEAMLKDVAERGNVPRFPNRNPEKWLTVINGQILGSTKPYLDNPLKYAEPTPQSLLEEGDATEPRRLLSRIEPVVNSLHLVGERGRSSDLASDPPLADGTIVIDALQGFESVGLLLDAEGAKKVLASARAVQDALDEKAGIVEGAFEDLYAAYDLSSLVSVYSNPNGVPDGLAFDSTKARLLEKRFSSPMGVLLSFSLATIIPKLPEVLEQMNRSGCDYVYLTSNDLGLSWDRTE